MNYMNDKSILNMKGNKKNGIKFCLCSALRKSRISKFDFLEN